MNFAVSPELINAAEKHEPQHKEAWPVRHSPSLLARDTHVPKTAREAEDLVAMIERLRVGAIAIDTEFGFHRDSVDLGRGKSWFDVSSIRPLILSAAVWIPDDGAVIPVMFDLRNPDLIPSIDRLLRLHVTFVAHNIAAEFQTLWTLGLSPVFHQVWDTYVAARALGMGRNHPWQVKLALAEQQDDWSEVEAVRAMETSRLSLVGQGAVYGIVHPFTASKGALQRSFLHHPVDVPYTDQQIRYSIADAEVTLRVYLAQQADIVAAGLMTALTAVEFPFAEANARMEFDGVPIDPARLRDLELGLAAALEERRGKLHKFGIANPDSPVQVRDYLLRKGLGPKMHRNSKFSSDDETLEAIETLDAAIPILRQYRKYRALLSGPLFNPELIGLDGRLHPTHRHLGADTGRNTCSAPNLAGLSRTFRPIVVAPEGRAIVEADFAQIEVGIAAAEFNDPDLIDAFNAGDVYSGVAMRFYAEDLTEDEKRLTLSEFKKRRGDLRDQIKVFVLAVIYGMRDQSIADRFGITLPEAARQRMDFLERFPGLGSAMRSATEGHRVSGFAPIVGGLRRAIPESRNSTNQAVNTPIQGSAGVVFRAAVVDLYRHFRGTTTKLVLPVHDAVVVECDADQVQAVAAEVRSIMSAAIRRYYPCLSPRVDINLSDTTCWNKDGHSDSILRFLEDPSFKV